ncbi:F-box/LRR-repeat protein [Apostasia shenzhenica]|uniref:F-box/LRR-repeat protein n=1 Tax=Apostasia shenzhenica TaxID=1088818 RepID=A0A2I0B2E4_9ASPA|nr:F-box/LRR-repeat protein [Apostasia shenzhenica]
MEGRRWEDLAYDCLVVVFSKLGLDDLAAGVPLVCKSWHGAAMDPQCWTTLDFEKLDFTSMSAFAARFKCEFHVKGFSFSSFFKLAVARSHGSASKIAIPSVPGNVLKKFDELNRRCPRIKELVLPTLLRREDKEIPAMIKKWKELEILQMKWKPTSFMEMLEQIRIHCPNFRGLQLCGFFERQDAAAMARCLPKLKRLKMRASVLRKEEMVMILEGCGELEIFDVTNCRGFVADNDIRNRGSRIKKFDYNGCKVESFYANGYCINYDDLVFALFCGD